MNCLPCLVNPIVDCGLCKKHLCEQDALGHSGSVNRDKLYCRECWWEVWREALYQSKVLQEKDERFQGKPKEAFAYIMGYTEKDKRDL